MFINIYDYFCQNLFSWHKVFSFKNSLCIRMWHRCSQFQCLLKKITCSWIEMAWDLLVYGRNCWSTLSMRWESFKESNGWVLFWKIRCCLKGRCISKYVVILITLPTFLRLLYDVNVNLRQTQDTAFSKTQNQPKLRLRFELRPSVKLATVFVLFFINH